MSRNVTARVLACVLSLSLLTACQQIGQGIADNPKTTLGGMLGAAGGGLIGAAAGGGAAGIVGGVLLGGLLGGAIGNHLDQKDKEMAAQNAQRSFEDSRSGQTSTWRNPDSGNYGSITPTRTYQESNGQYCREYTQEITIGGELHQSHGTACREPDGSWRTM